MDVMLRNLSLTLIEQGKLLKVEFCFEIWTAMNALRCMLLYDNLYKSARRVRILAIDTSTEACSVAFWDNGNCFSHFEECPRGHTQRILPLVKEILRQGKRSLTDLDALAFGRGPGSFTGVCIGIGIAQGLALGGSLPMIGISTLVTMAQGAFRQTGMTRVLAAIDARMGEVYWAEYIRDKQGIWHGGETETVYKPEEVSARMKMLCSGAWAMVGTGWNAWPEMAQSSSLTLVQSNILLPVAEDMLPIACQLLLAGKTVSVEHATPVYLRNKLAWKKTSGENNSLERK